MIDCPFTKIHCDLWSAGEIGEDGSQLHMLTAMCNMTQYVLITHAKSTLAYDLAPLFMQEVLLKVGFCVVVVIDEGGTFKGIFQEMCGILKIRCHTVARSNYIVLRR
jgi:hypothetical protein